MPWEGILSGLGSVDEKEKQPQQGWSDACVAKITITYVVKTSSRMLEVFFLPIDALN